VGTAHRYIVLFVRPPVQLQNRTVLAWVWVTGVSYFGLTILLLSLLDADYSPISQAASDYGVGRFAIEMNLGFLLGGVGMIAFALVVGGRGAAAQRSRAGSALFFVAGLVLMMDSYFTTNMEGAPATLHGTIHGFGGFVFFITAPIGVLVVSRKFGRARVLAAAVGLVVGFAMLAANAGLSGLAERVILLVIFSSVIVAARGFTKSQG
jgi:hypothetical protein